VSTCLTAHSVIELAPGTIRKTRTMRGDILEFDYQLRANETDVAQPSNK
jgi:hypothetical protein